MLESYLKYIQENYTTEDLVAHHGISAIVYDKNKNILMQDHVKLNLWTIPVGKIDEGESIIDSIKRELFEECGIKIIKFKEVSIFTKVYKRNGIDVEVIGHLFEIEKYSGIPKNKEPKKHRTQVFMSLGEIKKIKNLSDATLAALKYLKSKGTS